MSATVVSGSCPRCTAREWQDECVHRTCPLPNWKSSARQRLVAEILGHPYLEPANKAIQDKSYYHVPFVQTAGKNKRRKL